MSKRSDLPLDVLTNILSRLPRKSLKRFEWVSKSWRDLIKSDYLLNLHIRNFPDQYYTNRELFDVHAVLSNFFRLQGGVYLRFIGLNRIENVSDDYLDFVRPWNPSGLLNLSNYYNSRDCRDIKVSGPRNGMYCLYDHHQGQEQITLMRSSFKEVSFKEFKVVPQPSILWPPVGNRAGVTTVAEIGFDPKTNDYKVVLFRQWYERGTRLHQAAAVLFTLITNSWRKINDVDHLNVEILAPSSASISVPYVNENIHWLALQLENEDERRHIIVSFDMVREVFRNFNIPPNIGIKHNHGQRLPTLAVYKEYLSLIVYPPYRRQHSSELDIWIMQDYGNDESWTKKCSISIPVGRDRVLGFWQNDEQVFLNGMGTTRLYDLRTQQIVKSFKTACSDCKCRVYSESLVPIELRGHQFMYN